MGAAMAGFPFTFMTLALGATPYLIGTWTLVALLILLFISFVGVEDYIVTVVLGGDPEEYHFWSRDDAKSFLDYLTGSLPKGTTFDLTVDDDWKNVEAVVRWEKEIIDE